MERGGRLLRRTRNSTSGAGPELDLARAGQALAEQSEPLVDPLADRVSLERRRRLGREGGPLGLLAGPPRSSDRR
jgi:hypothetical protein